MTRPPMPGTTRPRAFARRGGPPAGRTPDPREDRTGMTLYALIDNEQQLHLRDGDYMPELGPEGADLVRLHPGTRMAAFVNDCGFSLPDRCPRNTLGALVAIRLGGVFRPLAGPVVFTGWNTAGCGSEVRDLTPENVQTLTGLHRDFAAALAGTYTGAAWWADTVRRDADALRAASTPTLTVLEGI